MRQTKRAEFTLTTCMSHCFSQRVLLVVMAQVFVSVLAAAQFEGIVESKNLTTDETGEPKEFVMTMLIRRDMVKIQTSSMGTTPASTMIYRSDKHLVWMLNDDDKTYFEIPRESGVERIQTPEREDKSAAPKPVKTGKVKKILGYSCSQIVFKRPGEETSIWATKELGNLFHAISKALGEEPTEIANDWTNELTKMGFFPLVSSTKIDGVIVESQEVTRIGKKVLNEALFDLPSGYQRQRLDEMMKGEN